MSLQAILAETAFALTGATLLAAIHREDPPSGPFILNLTNRNVPPELLLTNAVAPPGFLFTNSIPPLALELTNRSNPPLEREQSITPGVYVTHPWVIAVLVPGKIDSGIVRGSANQPGIDDIVQQPQLHLDPVK